jgi:hypothetical protein
MDPGEILTICMFAIIGAWVLSGIILGVRVSTINSRHNSLSVEWGPVDMENSNIRAIIEAPEVCLGATVPVVVGVKPLDAEFTGVVRDEDVHPVNDPQIQVFTIMQISPEHY